MGLEHELCDVKRIRKPRLRVRESWFKRYKIKDFAIGFLIGASVAFLGYENRDAIGTGIKNVSSSVVEYFDVLEKEKQNVKSKEKDIEKLSLDLGEQKRDYEARIVSYEGRIGNLEESHKSEVENLRKDNFDNVNNFRAGFSVLKKSAEDNLRQADEYRGKLTQTIQAYNEMHDQYENLAEKYVTQSENYRVKLDAERQTCTKLHEHIEKLEKRIAKQDEDFRARLAQRTVQRTQAYDSYQPPVDLEAERIKERYQQVLNSALCKKNPYMSTKVTEDYVNSNLNNALKKYPRPLGLR